MASIRQYEDKNITYLQPSTGQVHAGKEDNMKREGNPTSAVLTQRCVLYVFGQQAQHLGTEILRRS